MTAISEAVSPLSPVSGSATEVAGESGLLGSGREAGAGREARTGDTCGGTPSIQVVEEGM